MTDRAKSDKTNSGLTLIPWYSILEIGKVFVEGLRYGRNNWQKGVFDKTFQEERLEHAMLHLIKWKEGDRTENHLAKVAWFCIVQLDLQRQETDVLKNTRSFKKDIIDYGTNSARADSADDL